MLKKGLKLHYPESVAYITSCALEGAREGKSVEEVMHDATQVLTKEQVMDGVADMITLLQVEAVFTDGSRLVSSPYHIFEVNRYMEFDRPKAFGYHLNIPATTAIRFEPGEEKEVELVAFAGKQRIIGFDDLVNGYAGTEDSRTYYPKRTEALRRMQEYGYKSVSQTDEEGEYTQSQTQK